ncbi:MAG TPA: serine hydrolase domain-containing protein [Burkholderiaceae bacterium]|nr:serine hydrolase domain-containing protein [Burkholderiaceae bacterium]
MRQLTIAATLVFNGLAASTAAMGAPPSLEEAAERLQRQTPALMASARVPGLAMALVTDAGLAWQGTFGLADSRTREPVAQETVFEAASLSKPVFAHAVLQLVDAGLLGLDTPLAHYLPGGYDVGDDSRLAQITARHVLSHRTGFPNWRAAGAPLAIHFTPGERFSYSGEGFVYLARVVERLTGESTERTVKRLVFDPLGMTHSSFLWQDSHAQRKAFGHDARGESQGQRRFGAANPASSLSTTAPDFARFLIAVLNGERLKPETAAQMLRSQVRVGPSTSSIGRRATPLSDEVSWGLGWGLQQRGGDEAFWHWGDNGNSKAFAVVSRTQRRGLVFFANGLNGLAIAPDLVALALGEGRQPGLDWIDYRRWQQLPSHGRRNIGEDGQP